jgi:hypothetical protein
VPQDKSACVAGSASDDRLKRGFLSPLRTNLSICLELGTLLRSSVRSRSVLLAEKLFLRKQLAFHQERRIRPIRLTDAARLSLVFRSRFCNWKSVLVIVKPETLIGWHRRGFKLLWKLKSRPDRPSHTNAALTGSPLTGPKATACSRITLFAAE